MRDKWKSVIFFRCFVFHLIFNLVGPDGCHNYWHDLEMEQEVYCCRKFGEFS